MTASLCLRIDIVWGGEGMSERVLEIESECCNNRFVQRNVEERTYVMKKTCMKT
jgi:hypothetical protein